MIRGESISKYWASYERQTAAVTDQAEWPRVSEDWERHKAYVRELQRKANHNPNLAAVAADIVSRLDSLRADLPLNAAQAIENLIRAELEPK